MAKTVDEMIADAQRLAAAMEARDEHLYGTKRDTKPKPKHAKPPGDKPADDKRGKAPARLITVRASRIVQKPVEWDWRNRIARGKVTLIAGDPDLGKSQIINDIVARLTIGRSWPDGGSAPKGFCFMLSAEDAADDTI